MKKKKIASSSISSSCLSFFKIMIGDFTNTLRIPPAFVKRYGEMISSLSFSSSSPGKTTTITLEISRTRSRGRTPRPSPRSWVVEVKKIENDLFFGKGWGIFVEDNGFEIGDFLVFTYIGNSTFDVLPYDKTACVKETDHILPTPTYDNNNTNKKRRITLTSQNDDDDPQYLETNKQGRQLQLAEVTSDRDIGKEGTGLAEKIKGGPQLVYSSETAMNQDKLHGNPRLSIRKSEQSNLKGAHQVYEDEETEDSSVEILGISTLKTTGSERKEIMYLSRSQQAVKRRDRRSVQFSVQSTSTIRQTALKKKLNRGEQLRSRKSLVPVHSSCPSNGSMTTSHESSSHKNHKDDESSAMNDTSEAMIASGKEGPDSLTEEESFDSAAITRKLSPAMLPPINGHPPTTQQTGRARKAAEESESSPPSFHLVLRKSYVQRAFLNIPFKFVQQYLIKRLGNRYMDRDIKNVKLRGPDGRTWSVRLTHANAKAYLCNGWTPFVRENDLRLGDICLFQLIKTRGIELKVSFFRILENKARLTLAN